MNTTQSLRQPFLGILGTVISVLIALSIMIWFTAAELGSWITFLFICAIPTQMILSLVWQNAYPKPSGRLEQPAKGLYFLAITLIGGLIVAGWIRKIVPGFFAFPGPVQNHFIILTVVTTLWLIVVWQCWPVSALFSHPAFVGLGTLLLAYVLNWVVFRLFWSFEVMAQAPFYVANSDPLGLFSFDKAMAFAVTTVGVILAMVLLDMWPLSWIAMNVPAIGKQPVWGVALSALVLAVSGWIYYVCVNLMGMDPTVFLVRVSVSWIFGEFIMLLMLQTAPFQTLSQPVKGVLVLVCSAVLAVAMFQLYSAFAHLLGGDLPSGPSGNYALELWIASAMLAVTFPLLVLYSSFFEFWPFSEPVPAATAENAASQSTGPEGPAGAKDLEGAVSKYLE